MGISLYSLNVLIFTEEASNDFEVRYFFPVLIFVLSLTLICGCGGANKKRPPLGKVKGKVIYKGQPVPAVVVTQRQMSASHGDWYYGRCG